METSQGWFHSSYVLRVVICINFLNLCHPQLSLKFVAVSITNVTSAYSVSSTITLPFSPFSSFISKLWFYCMFSASEKNCSCSFSMLKVLPVPIYFPSLLPSHLLVTSLSSSSLTSFFSLQLYDHLCFLKDIVHILISTDFCHQIFLLSITT